jgi:multiple sugar transport system permease protein
VPSAGGAFGVFFLRQFFGALPRELEEAAVLDGANQWQVFWRVVLPLARPGLATLTVLAFLTNWNDFLWPVYVLFTPEHLTLPAGLSTLQNAAATNYPIVMAGAVVASVPVIALFVAAQRHVIASVAQSGIKG